MLALGGSVGNSLILSSLILIKKNMPWKPRVGKWVYRRLSIVYTHELLVDHMW